jgi:uncharacterized protein
MNAVLLDTVGLLALWDEADQWHAAAEAAFLNLLANRRNLVTTPQILLECGNAAARRPYRSNVFDLRRSLQLQNALLEPSAAEIDEAWTAYRSGRSGDAGIVDHISFVVMRRAGLRDVFTNDRHFALAGFSVLF